MVQRGVTNFEFTMGGKWLEALKEVSPWLVRIAVLYSPKTVPYAGSLLRSIAAAAPSFAVEPIDTPIMKLRRSNARSTLKLPFPPTSVSPHALLCICKLSK